MDIVYNKKTMRDAYFKNETGFISYFRERCKFTILISLHWFQEILIIARFSGGLNSVTFQAISVNTKSLILINWKMVELSASRRIMKRYYKYC